MSDYSSSSTLNTPALTLHSALPTPSLCARVPKRHLTEHLARTGPYQQHVAPDSCAPAFIEGNPHVRTIRVVDIDDISDDECFGPRECGWEGCGRLCASLSELVQHVTDDHIGAKKSKYTCKWRDCHRHQQPFYKKHKILSHMRIHTGERPYVCHIEGCGRKFSRQDGLNTHLITHQSTKVFTCPAMGCDKAYYHQRSLRKHVRTFHPEIPTSVVDSIFQGINPSLGIFNSPQLVAPGLDLGQYHPHYPPFQPQHSSLHHQQQHMHLEPQHQNQDDFVSSLGLVIPSPQINGIGNTVFESYNGRFDSSQMHFETDLSLSLPPITKLAILDSFETPLSPEEKLLLKNAIEFEI